MCVKGLLIYLKQDRKECVLGPLFKLLEALFELFVPLVMTSIIDVGIATGSRRYILERCGLLVLLAVVGLVCSITAQYLRQGQPPDFPLGFGAPYLPIFRGCPTGK